MLWRKFVSLNLFELSSSGEMKYPSTHSHLSEDPCSLGHTLSPSLLLHILPVDSSHSWGSLQDSLGLLLISSQAPGQLPLAQCPSRGGGPVNVPLFSWSGSCQSYVLSKVLALTWETGGTLLAFSRGVLLICCVI